VSLVGSGRLWNEKDSTFPVGWRGGGGACPPRTWHPSRSVPAQPGQQQPDSPWCSLGVGSVVGRC